MDIELYGRSIYLYKQDFHFYVLFFVFLIFNLDKKANLYYISIFCNLKASTLKMLYAKHGLMLYKSYLNKK